MTHSQHLTTPVTHLKDTLLAVIQQSPVRSSSTLPNPIGGSTAVAPRGRALKHAQTGGQLPCISLRGNGTVLPILH